MKIKIRDNKTGQVFEYGTNRHHALSISEDGSCLTFENLQNGDGSNGGGYSFVLDDGKTPAESDSDDAMNGMTYANIAGFKNVDVEKILQEIEKLSEKHPYKIQGNYETYSQYNEAWQDCIDMVEGIIERNISKNDGWIPVEERLPTEEAEKFIKEKMKGKGFL